MPSDLPADDAFDDGLLSPVSVGHDALASDREFLDAMVAAEVALTGAYADIGVAPAEAVGEIEAVFRADRGIRISEGIDPRALATAAVSGGNPVIALVGLMKARVSDHARPWIHRGATSQDIWDSAIMLGAIRSVRQIEASLRHAVEGLLQSAEAHRDDVAAARTLTQHAVPTTVGLRATVWARGLRRAADRLAALDLPAQLGGAGGTLASFVEITGSQDDTRRLVAAYARRLGMPAPDVPWHVTRWPVTELGDALVQAVDAIGAFAGDIATLSRTEIAEVSVGGAGGSSSMPQKRNPTEAVLLRSAAIRAPQLAATLHVCSALAADERPDGAWHAEWPTLRELLRLALGASWHASALAAHLTFDPDAARRNLAVSRGLIVAERLSIVLGADAAASAIAEAQAGADLGDAVRRAVDASGIELAADVDIDTLIDPARYTGLAGALVDDAVRDLRAPTAETP